MAFRTKRRKPRVVWLPQSIHNRFTSSGDITVGNQNGIGYANFDYVGGFGNRSDFVMGLARDTQSSPALVDGLTSLSDLYNSAYRLRRIVGQLHINHIQAPPDIGPDTNIPTQVLIGVGFIVLRVDAETQDPEGLANDYSVFSADNTSDPWIWRRSWQLANSFQYLANDRAGYGFPIGNFAYGDAFSGPHVDARTARIISLQERMFMVVSAIAYDGDPAFTGQFNMTWDLRFLASMRTSLGNRRNASR